MCVCVRQKQSTKVPENLFGNSTEEVSPSLTYQPHIATQGFYELCGYSGSDLATDVLTVAQAVGQSFETISFEFIDQFIRIKIGFHTSIQSQCIINKQFVKPNVFVRLIPFYKENDVSPWLGNDVMIEVHYQAYSTTFETKSNAFESKCTAAGVELRELAPITSIRPLPKMYQNKALSDCYPLNLRARYWDYNNADWAEAIRIHNYKIRQSYSNVVRTPTLVTSHAQKQKSRDNNSNSTNVKRDRKDADLSDGDVEKPYVCHSVFYVCQVTSGFYCL